MVQMLGYGSEAEVLRCITDISTQVYANPEAREFVLAAIKSEGKIEQYEVEFLRRDGSTVWVSMTAKMLIDADGRPPRLEGLIRDINQRKRTDWLDQDRRLLLEMIARNEPLTQTLQAICHAAERQCPGVRGMILVHEEARRQIGAAPEFSPAFVLAMDEMLNLGINVQPDGPFCGSSGFVPDITADPRWVDVRDAAMSEGLLACHTIPITGRSWENGG